ncbi:MAG TPA: M20/M25/M40 family metallo-hydrolase [Pirellulales bacterium]|nr:M20/M25/M40 family metallo-hydrolase [Pirellulales bacterium]
MSLLFRSKTFFFRTWPSLFCRAGQYLLLVACVAGPLSLLAADAENQEKVASRISDAVRLLASDELEGRGIGTEGLKRAAEFIAQEFEKIGLETRVVEGTPYQPFAVTTDAQLGPADANRLSIVGPGEDPSKKAKAALQFQDDYMPLAAGGSGTFDLPLVFVGYGITEEHADYDDYAGVDVKGKAVIIMRHQPLQGDVHSPFGKNPSRHAYFKTKISNAFAHGAAAILFCTGTYETDKQTTDARRQWQTAVDTLATANSSFKEIAQPSAEQLADHRQLVDQLAKQIGTYSERIDAAHDPLLEFHRAGNGGPDRQMPIFHIRRAALNQVLLKALGSDLATLEAGIDRSGKPDSRPLVDWRLKGQSSVIRSRAQIRNVIGILEGEGPLAEEAIIIGAHYDHLGYGDESSVERESHEVHNGADDNASGVAALLEVARRLKNLGKKLPRRIVFIAFTGEERGLLGSAHYIKHPLVPLKDTVAMLNMDMVGRLRDNKLIVHGTGTAAEFDLLVKRLNAGHNFKVVKKPSGFGPSDHASFYEKKIPVLHFFTGAHQDYHRPGDDFEKVNIKGIERVSLLVAEVAASIAEAEGRPVYQKTKRTRVAGGRWPYFGSRPDYGYEKPGIRMAGISPGSPAERGGLVTGDVIVQFGDAKVATVTDFANVLSRHKAGELVKVVVLRDGEEKTLSVILDPPRK